MNETISVIIPLYQHSHTIYHSWQTILSQTLCPAEVVIVDDGSTDNPKLVLEKIKKEGQENNILVKIFSQTNAGANSARNLGLKNSTGEYVIFWDADTIANPKMLEKMLAALKHSPNASYAYSGFKFGVKTMGGIKFDVEKLRQNNFVDITSLIKRSGLPSNGLDESLKRFQDWDLWLTMLENNKTGVLVPEILYKKLVGLRKGYSLWLPRLFYRLPFKITAVKKFEAAKLVVQQKHHLV